MKSLPTSYAVLIGALLISIAILASSGVGLGRFNVTKLLGMTNVCDDPQTGEDRLTCLASQINLDTKKFQSCLASDKHKQEVAKDQSDAEAAGMSGTPGFVVGKEENGKVEGVKIVGAYPYATFKTVLDELLKGTSAEDIIKIQEGLEPGSASIDDDPILGKKDAQLTMVEFSDYECPFCKRHFTQTLPSLKKDYIDTGKVKLVYRDFIAVDGHNPAATQEAEAANCAREQGGDETYFKYHDLIFQNTKSNGEGISL